MVSDRLCSIEYFWNILLKVNHSWTWYRLWAHSVVKVTFLYLMKTKRTLSLSKQNTLELWSILCAWFLWTRGSILQVIPALTRNCMWKRIKTAEWISPNQIISAFKKITFIYLVYFVFKVLVGVFFPFYAYIYTAAHPSSIWMLSVCCNAQSQWVMSKWSYSNSYIRACILNKYCLGISKHWPAFSLL